MPLQCQDALLSLLGAIYPRNAVLSQVRSGGLPTGTLVILITNLQSLKSELSLDMILSYIYPIRRLELD